MPKARSTQETKAAILQAATDCFAAAGFAGASVKVVARRAQVSQGLIYHHFGDKEGLWRAVHEAIVRHYLDELAEHQEAHAHLDPWARLLARIRHGLHYGLMHPNSLRLRTWDTLGHAPSMQESAAVVALAHELEAMQAAGVVRCDVDAKEMALYISWACLGWCAAQVEKLVHGCRQVELVAADARWIDLTLESLRPTLVRNALHDRLGPGAFPPDFEPVAAAHLSGGASKQQGARDDPRFAGRG